eukprot:TCALIF_03892-PA protein Name:"Protein of unknown function" AED:0.25 eAED:0.31 QI:0/0/0/0.6/1/1/5/0/298
MSQGHSWFAISGILALLLAFILTLLINGLAGSVGKESGLVEYAVGELSDIYDTYMTPAGWAFAIWSLIYIWMAVLLIFYIVTIFQSNDFGKVYLNPEVANFAYRAIFIANLSLNASWILLWGNNYLLASCIILFLIAITNIILLGIFSFNIAEDNHRLKSEQSKLFWTYVVLGQNCHGTYTAWTLIASCISLATELSYGNAGLNRESSSLIGLSLLLAIVVIWFVLENTVLDRYVRFLVTPYLVVIWAAIATVTEHQSSADIPDVIEWYVIGILVLAGVLAILRAGIIAYRQIKMPFK